LLSDWIGKSGLEASYEKYLKGKNGIEQVEVDSQGSIIRVLVDENNREPEEGESISLYLDSGLQEKAGEYLIQGMEEAKKLTGEESGGAVAIVMNVKNGGILSMVSLPSYDDNLFAKGILSADYQNLVNDPKKPMFNRATSGTYPPGSIIKIIMASAGLSEGVISVNTSLDTPPSIEVGEWSFPDWKDHGITNVERAIAESNNIFFYALGGGYDKIKGIGINNMKRWWQKFGLGSKTGIDLATEASGLLPDPDWKEKVFGEPWYIGDTYHAAIGQGDLLITPLQMVRAVATIANGGKLLAPQLVQKISDKDGNIVEEYGARVQNKQVAPPEVISTVERGMRMAVTEGSARTLNDLPYKVAGKTGTAQFFSNQKTHAWFECYAPYDNPEIAVIVLVEGGGGGHEIAVPVARNILEYYFANK
jgi:penicillin-binding protein 2